MAKRSRKQGLDTVSATQENSKWFFGHRTRSFWTERTDAEWTQYRQNITNINKPALRLGILFAVVNLIGSLGLFIVQGFQPASIILAVVAIFSTIQIVVFFKKVSRRKEKE